MIFKHKNSSSAKIKISNFKAESLFYISGKINYIGNAERISISGISTKSNRRVFIRDITANDFQFENKVDLSQDDSIDVFLSIQSTSEVWVDILKLDVKESLKSKISLLMSSSNNVTQSTAPSSLNKKIICNHIVTPFSVNKSTISINFTGMDSILVEGYDQNHQLLLKRKVKSGVSYPTIFRTNKDSCRIDYFVSNKVTPEVIVNKVDFLETIFEHTSSTLNQNSVTAAMATYPAREHIYLDTVNSIINQVDILYIYFNGYDNVPEEILNHNQKHKIEYILSPKSTLRASGKFSWIGSIPGYHLTIDDDIIYPSDYVEHLMSEAKLLDDENIIIGVHGSVFKTNVKDASKCRDKIFNFQDGLVETRLVHMIGSGTALFTPSSGRLIDVHDLLSHPLANDELLAIQSKNIGIRIYCVKREPQWLTSNTAMEFGVYEEKQLNKNLKDEVNSFVISANPWDDV
ncbi:hypothetical protein AD24_4774 [Escherichia coli 2-011-08_S4_C3]|uniref:hypothetical protein n=1 Tax=Escherichia coli TaxID=562 RepID=UPI0004D58EA4|nr:hypothetical protein [Escherichia coli]KDS96051.1 hypothetical protein AC66_4838 [Escherichia coli 2-011-08_S4_C1]KDT11172.1 hypothetical protein AD24_4774 [Escherichia coli 2-011-08_S4_C3]MDQ9248561.1 hypothetical protein [Escherichia coli]HAV9442125.1 hypothetical protein [Escherichia coli]HCP6383615.1 hypothetical protein [Escherichia coli]